MTNETMKVHDLSSFIGIRKEIASVEQPSANALTKKTETDFTAIGRILPLSGVIPSATAG
nr:MAG TPA: hypothetical protein [Caudoviricetes sp.]